MAASNQTDGSELLEVLSLVRSFNKRLGKIEEQLLSIDSKLETLEGDVTSIKSKVDRMAIDIRVIKSHSVVADEIAQNIRIFEKYRNLS